MASNGNRENPKRTVHSAAGTRKSAPVRTAADPRTSGGGRTAPNKPHTAGAARPASSSPRNASRGNRSAQHTHAATGSRSAADNTHSPTPTRRTGAPSSPSSGARSAPNRTRTETGGARQEHNSVKPVKSTAASNAAAKKPRTTAKKKEDKNGKKRTVIIVVAIIAAILIAVGITLAIVLTRGEPDSDDGADYYVDLSEPGVQDINYRESLELIKNPDQGFYRPSFVRLTAAGATAGKPLYDGTQLYHLRVDISAFSGAVNHSGDIEITQEAVDGFNAVLDFYESKGRSYIVRFCYDPNFGGKANMEPSIDMMLAHIDAFAPALNSHADALTAVEVGMVGPWGEMHTSAAANAENINKLIGEFLTEVKDTPILVRTPKMIYNYLGITIDDLDTYRISADSPEYRLGLFNDGYLGSENDLGTYSKREAETDWLALQNDHLPYGGEVTVPGSSMHDIDKCLPEMFKLGLSYLNYEWNNEVVQKKWVNSVYTSACGSDKAYYGQSAYTYIQNRLGYRLRVKKSKLTVSDGKLDVALDIQNVGFGNFNRKKTATVCFVKDGEENAEAIYASAGMFTGGNFTASVDLPEASGGYNVYLAIHSGDAAERKYAVRLANADMFDEKLQANRIGKITV